MAAVEEWRFSYEALHHLLCLRLSLFHNLLSPLGDCLDLETTFQGPPASPFSVLNCRWDSADGKSHSLHVPIPPCLLDLSAPIRFSARGDHIEIKIQLLSLDGSFRSGFPLLELLSSDASQLRNEKEGNHEALKELRCSFSLDSAEFQQFHIFTENPGGTFWRSSSVVPVRVHTLKCQVVVLGGAEISDAQALTSHEGIMFYCNVCSSKLTHTPFRRIVELPSADWREVAEHWFGSCCCSSFGVKTESLVAQFQQLFVPAEGTCLVTSTTCIVHHNDILGDGACNITVKDALDCDADTAAGVGIEDARANPDMSKEEGLGNREDDFVDKEGIFGDPCTREVTSSNMYPEGTRPNNKADLNTPIQGLQEISWVGNTNPESLEQPLHHMPQNLETVGNFDVGALGLLNDKVGGETGLLITSCDVSGSRCRDEELHVSSAVDRECWRDTATESSVTPDCIFPTGAFTTTIQHPVALRDPAQATNEWVGMEGIQGELENLNSCCMSSKCFKETIPSKANIESAARGMHSLPEAETGSMSLGNGFMTGPGGPSEASEWDPYFCNACSSLVGASSKETERHPNSSKKGVHFFKCLISTDEVSRSSLNVFRHHTLERVITHQLQANTEGTGSCRYLVRSFTSQAPLLQLVLLNQDAWICTGACNTNYVPGPEAALDGLDRQQTLQVSGEESGMRGGMGRASSLVSAREVVPAILQPVVKLMYRDCSKFGADELSLVEDWVHQQQVDEIYMLEEVVAMLTGTLQANQILFPMSCRSFQQFTISFLEK